MYQIAQNAIGVTNHLMKKKQVLIIPGYYARLPVISGCWAYVGCFFLVLWVDKAFLLSLK